MVTGKIEADSPAAVATKLKSMGYAPVKHHRRSSTGGMQTEIKLPTLGAKVKLKELAIFSRQFATMINSGLSLLRALIDPRGADREQGARQGPRRGPQDVETGTALSVGDGQAPARSSRR